MASEFSYLSGRAITGVAPQNTRLPVTILFPILITGTGTYTLTTGIPSSWITSVRMETPVAISGAPSTCNTRVGTTAAAQDIVADVDAKAQGHITNTLVTAFDVITNNAANLFVQTVVSGGTAPAGTINVIVTLHPNS